VDNKFSMVSVEYALHINHIQKAREHFERECSSFLNDITCFLDKRFEDLSSRDLKIDFVSNESCKMSTLGNARNFWIYSQYDILARVSKNKNSKRRIIGHFVTGISFDQTENAFTWYCKFHNTNELDPQIDEMCEQKIMHMNEEERDKVFPNFQSHKFDEFFFTNWIIDEDFHKDYQTTLNSSIKILSQSITDSPKFQEFHTKAAVSKVLKYAG